MKTIGDVLKLSATFLEERKIDRSRRSSEELLCHVLGMKRMDLYLQFDRPVIESELTVLRELLKRFGKGEPLEYVIGEVEFFGCKLQIDKNVLIPRPETEILVEMISKRIKKGVLWDVCTGSGCIGIALKKALPELEVTLSDISKEALAIAAQNGKGTRVEILHGDLLEPFKGRKADFIVCNPPYISESEFFTLDPSVRNFEPKLALVGGTAGTEIYARLGRELPPFLNPGAKVFLEIGAGQEAAIKQIFSGAPWVSQELIRDYAGHPRFFFLEKQ